MTKRTWVEMHGEEKALTMKKQWSESRLGKNTSSCKEKHILLDIIRKLTNDYKIEKIKNTTDLTLLDKYNEIFNSKELMKLHIDSYHNYVRILIRRLTIPIKYPHRCQEIGYENSIYSHISFLDFVEFQKRLINEVKLNKDLFLVLGQEKLDILITSIQKNY